MHALYITWCRLHLPTALALGTSVAAGKFVCLPNAYMFNAGEASKSKHSSECSSIQWTLGCSKAGVDGQQMQAV